MRKECVIIMNRLFNPEGPVLQFVNKIVYSVYLNILWFICCVPIVTAGASTTALFYTTLKIADGDDAEVTRKFFRAFKSNFRQSTIVWLILLGVGVLLAIDGYVFFHMRFSSAVWTIGTAVFIVILIVYAMILMYIFPLMARFENTVRAMFKNSLLLAVRFLFCTILMALVYAAMIFVVIRLFTPAIIFGEGLCALICSHLMKNILKLLEEKAEGAESPENAEENADEETS